MRGLNWSLFEDEVDHEGAQCLYYHGTVQSYDALCKAQKGGFKGANTTSTTITIFNENLLFEINRYKMFIKHRDLSRETKNASSDFFGAQPLS